MILTPLELLLDCLFYLGNPLGFLIKLLFLFVECIDVLILFVGDFNVFLGNWLQLGLFIRALDVFRLGTSYFQFFIVALLELGRRGTIKFVDDALL